MTTNCMIQEYIAYAEKVTEAQLIIKCQKEDLFWLIDHPRSPSQNKRLVILVSFSHINALHGERFSLILLWLYILTLVNSLNSNILVKVIFDNR